MRHSTWEVRKRGDNENTIEVCDKTGQWGENMLYNGNDAG